MNPYPEEIDGLVGFFDVLGYRQIVNNNDLSGCHLALNRLEASVEKVKDSKEWTEAVAVPPFEVIAFSDSFLVYTPASNTISEFLFGLACGRIVTTLFWDGLPVRGAISRGKFLVRLNGNSQYFAGLPIVEAHEFADCLEMAGCLIAPSAESVFGHLPVCIRHAVPLKGHQRQEMIMLNNYLFWEKRDLSREIVLEKFREHNKRTGPDVLSKVNNTLNFLEACKRMQDQAGRTAD